MALEDPSLAALMSSLRSFFARRVARPDDVEDLVQECLLRVHGRIGELRDQERLAAWVQRIARNLLVDHARRRGAEPGTGSQDLPLAELSHEASSAEGEAEREVAAWLPDFVAGLPEAYRQAVHLAEIEGLAHREIAQRLSLSISGVKSRVQRGRRRLRERLQACCELEFDRRGGVVGWRPRQDSCGC